MRVDLNPKTPEAPEGKGPTRANSGRMSSPAAEISQDQANLASQARVRALETQLQQSADVRQNRVEALVRAIQNGQYNVSSDKIANSIYSEMAANSGLIR